MRSHSNSDIVSLNLISDYKVLLYGFIPEKNHTNPLVVISIHKK